MVLSQKPKIPLMDLHYRKLLPDPLNDTQSCSGVCNSTDEFNFCRSTCYIYCRANCPLKILEGIPPSPPHHSVPAKYLISGLVLGVTVLILLCLTIYYKFYTGPRRRPADQRNETTREEFLDEDHGPVLDHPIWYINTVGLHPSIINSISVFKYRKSDGLVEGTDCSVCLSEFQEDETLRLLPKCSHAFHVPCIDTWLRSHTNCPLCRAPIVVQIPVTAGSSTESSSNGGGREETRIGISENNEEIDREIEGGDGELRIEMEERELEVDNIIKSNEEEGFQPMRRSVSLDSLSAFKISEALASVHSHRDPVKEDGSNMEIGLKREGSSNQDSIKFRAISSIGRAVQASPSSLKRSFSCGGKLLLQRYSRNSSSVLPL